MLCFYCWSHQIENQRQYLQRIWREGREGSTHHYGLPPNYFPKHLVSLGGSRQVNTKQFDYRYGSIQKNNDFTSSVNVYSPALLNVFLFEIHPSLWLLLSVGQNRFKSCHLYPRLVLFEAAKQKDGAEQSPTLITAILKDGVYLLMYLL